MIIECFENNAMLFFLKCYVSFHKHVRRLSSKSFITYYAYYQEVHQYLLYGSKGI